jgi:acylphosphatase
VRNRPGGGVEAVFEGEDGAVDAMVAWCRIGPGGARVTGLEAHEESPAGATTFAITG